MYKSERRNAAAYAAEVPASAYAGENDIALSTDRHKGLTVITLIL